MKFCGELRTSMTTNLPRDTKPLPRITWVGRLKSRYGMVIVASASVLLIILASLGGWWFFRLGPGSGASRARPELPPSLTILATQFPELGSVLQDKALDSVYKDFLVIYKRDGPDAALSMARKRGLINANNELRLVLELDTTDSSALQAQLEARGIKVTSVGDNLIGIAIPLDVLEKSLNSNDPGSLF
jgi:hypothetical protein